MRSLLTILTISSLVLLASTPSTHSAGRDVPLAAEGAGAEVMTDAGACADRFSSPAGGVGGQTDAPKLEGPDPRQHLLLHYFGRLDCDLGRASPLPPEEHYRITDYLCQRQVIPVLSRDSVERTMKFLKGWLIPKETAAAERFLV